MSTLRELLEARIAELEAATTDRVSDRDRIAALQAALAGGFVSPEARAFIESLHPGVLAALDRPPEPQGSPPVSDVSSRDETVPPVTTEPRSPPTVTRVDNRGMVYDAPADPFPLGWNNHHPSPDSRTESCGPFTEEDLWQRHLANHGGSRRRAIATWRRPDDRGSVVVHADFPLRRCVPPFQE